MYDLIVLGGGPAGYTAAIAAGRRGGKVLLFEATRIGGTCLNSGCIPTKYLLDKGGVLKRLRELARAAIIRDAGQFSYSRIVRGKDAAVKRLADGVAGLLKSHGVEVRAEHAELAAPGVVKAAGREYRSKNILVATGSEPVAPPFPGVELALDSSDILAAVKAPPRLAVIGGGVIGIELASAMHAFGSEVAVLETLPELFPDEERAIIRLVAKQLSRNGISVLTGARVTAIAAKGTNRAVHWEIDGKPGKIEVDAVLLAAGRKARLGGIDAASLGLELRKGAIAVDERLRTNLPGVYAAGDVVGGWQLAHAAYAEAECAVDNMFGAARAIDLSVMPRCVYTMPPFASVGMTSRAAETAGIAFNVGRFPYAASGMALAEDAVDGEAVVLSEKKTGRILGAHVFGECAHELISTAAMAVATGLTVARWERVVTPHPSLSEILPEAALAGVGLARHIQ